MYEIEIANNQDRLTLDEDYLRRVVTQTLTAEEVSAASISIAILDNPSIHDLNREYLQHDYETDVLSFLLEESGGTDDLRAPRGSKKQIDGEIVASADYAADQAAIYQWEPLSELTLYIVHGLLHLCGYDDLAEEELPVMRARERDIMGLLGIETVARDDGDTAPAAATISDAKTSDPEIQPGETK